MRLRNRVLGLVPVGLLMSSCVLSTSESEEDIAALEQNLYPDTTRLLPQDKPIPVCWVRSTIPTEPTKREWVKSAVQGSWERYANVQFTDWTPCDGQQAIRITVKDERPNADLGPDPNGYPQDILLNFTFKNWNPPCQSNLEYCIRAYAIHEFGHALGFAHEQTRADTPESCTQKEPNDPSGNYAYGAWDEFSVMNYCSLEVTKLSEIDIAGVRAMYGPKRLENFGYSDFAGVWRVDKHLRTVADVNGDRLDDIVGFGDWGVWVALSTGDGKFSPAREYIRNFSYLGQGYRNGKHPRFLSDVNLDRRADIVAFADNGVYVSLANSNTYDTAERAIADFGSDRGWSVSKHPRMMADVNGDRRPDIVGFGDAGVYVSLSLGGAAFGPQQRWIADFAYGAGGWFVERHPRMMADVNGDGRADVVGFADPGVYVALSTGSSFQPARQYSANFGYTAGVWRVEKHLRMMEDVNRDGRADIVAIGDNGVYVALSQGTAFAAPSFTSGFGYNQNWRVDRHVRKLADVTGDGRPDLVGFGENDVTVMVGNGSGFYAPAPFYVAPGKVVRRLYGTDDLAGSLTAREFVRTVGNLNADGVVDLIGFNGDGVQADLTDPLPEFQPGQGIPQASP